MYLRIIMEKYGFVYILLGDFIRREIERKFFFGREMEVYFSRGDFILDIIVNILIILKFCCQRENFIFDGYLRMLEQVIFFENYFFDYGIKLDLVLEIFIDEDMSVERIFGRRICFNCGVVYYVKYNLFKVLGICDVCGFEFIQRVDDREEVVRKRYRIYLKNMELIIKFYCVKGIYVRVDGDGLISEVWKRIQFLLDYIYLCEEKRKEYE